MPSLPHQPQMHHDPIRVERLAGVEPAISALAVQRLREVPEFTAVFAAVKAGVFLRKTPLGLMGFRFLQFWNRCSARPQPLTFWLREGDSNPFRLWCQRPPSCHWTIPEYSFFFAREHTSLIHVRRPADIVTNWLASKASNLEFPRSERGVFPVTLLANDFGCAGGIRTRITLINSQVLCQLRYRAMLSRN